MTAFSSQVNWDAKEWNVEKPPADFGDVKKYASTRNTPPWKDLHPEMRRQLTIAAYFRIPTPEGILGAND
jgi:hypothetical protein